MEEEEGGMDYWVALNVTENLMKIHAKADLSMGNREKFLLHAL